MRADGAFETMPKSVRIALDAMGGDHGPGVVVPGAAIALERRPDLQFIFVGDEALIQPLLAARPKLAAVARVVHTLVSVKMDDRPSQALRAGRRTSSMWLALDPYPRKPGAVLASLAELDEPPKSSPFTQLKQKLESKRNGN